jgi:outer membrane protein OmpA-like peptidoglycan-associated protein
MLPRFLRRFFRRALPVAAFGLSLQLHALHAQSQTRQPGDTALRETFSLGAYAGMAFTTLSGGFAVDRAGVLTASDLCGRFEHGTGTGPVFGLILEVPLTESLRFTLAPEYEDRSATMRYTCVDVADIRVAGGGVTQAVTDHVADISQSAITARLMASYRPFKFPLTLSAGPALSLTMHGSYSVREEVVSPSGAEFVTGGQVRPYGEGTLSNGGPLHVGLTGGVAWTAKIGERWSLRPELSYMLGVSQSLPSVGISSRALRLTLGILQRFDGVPTPPPATPEPPPAEPPVAPPLQASLDLNSVEEGGHISDTLHLSALRTIGTRLHPLLTYVFFDRGSSDIPQRYVRRTPEEIARFSMAILHDSTTLGIYYNMLDVIGLRLRSHPGTSIRVIGTEPDAPADAGTGDGSLAHRRADAIRSYFATNWGIEPSRIETIARRDPATPTNPETEDGAAENRRVEITSESFEIVEPVVLTDTTLALSRPSLRITPGLGNQSDRTAWEIGIDPELPGGHPTALHGTGSPARTDLPIDSMIAGSIPLTHDGTIGSVEVRLTARDGDRQKQVERRIPVVLRITSDSVHFGAGYYSLILFDFGSSKLRAEHRQTIALVNERTESAAEARVLGYTDKLGEAEYNRRLSADRANAVAAQLRAHVREAIGYGEGISLYDNTLPEGRFYSRSVTIETK